MAESFYEKRRKELGLTSSSGTNSSPMKTSTQGSSSFYSQRRQELGLDPAPKSEPYKQTIKDLERNANRADINLSPVESAKVRATLPEVKQRPTVAEKFDRNPVFKFFGKADELGMRAANRVGDWLGIGRGLAKSQPDRFNAMPGFLKDATKDVYRPAVTGAEKTADVTGEMLSYIQPSKVAYKLLGKTALKKAGPVLGRVLTGIAAEGGVQSAKEIGAAASGLDNQTLGQRALDVGMAGGLGGVGEAAVPLVKMGIQKGVKSLEGTLRGVQKAQMGVVRSKGVIGKAQVAEVAAAREPLTPMKQVDETPLISDEIKSFDPQEFKDISGFSAQTRDLYRNMEHALGDHAKPYLEAFNGAKKDNIVMQEYWVNRLKTEVVDKLGIKKDSKLSALTQKFGEKQITLDELKQKAPKDWEKVVEADKWFRESYDHLIDIVNESRSKVYPGNPDKIVPKRSDYYRHFRELNGLEGFKNLFDTPAGIDPSLAGISEFTKPKSKFASFMQKRGMGPFKNDAVGGFLNYIPAATYATHIDPQISNFRSLASALADTTKESKNMNHFIEFLHDFSNDLSGKTNPADRFVQKIIPGGRKTMAAISWLSNRVKSNVILGNLRSTLAQTANIPNGIAYAKQYSLKGAADTMASIFKENPAMKQSGFLKERYAGEMYRQFNTDWLSLGNPLHIKKFAEWMMETTDQIGTNFVWNSVYTKGLAEKVADPIAYADDITRKLIAGRGIGEVPLLQKARITQLVAPFQLEVANLWRVMGDFVRKKDFTGLATLFVANYLFNRGMEKVTGSGVTLDPIQAMIEAFGTPDLTPQQRAGRLAGEVFSNLPGGQSIAGAMPEYGGTVLGVNVPSRKALFGDNDPTRFGSGLPIVKGIQDPLHMIVPGFGGNQIKKMTQGVDAIKKGGAYDPSGKLKFPVKDSPLKAAQMLAFGPNSTSEAQNYYKNDRRPLSANDTATYRQLPNKDEMYKSIMKQRDLAKIEKKATDIQKDKTLTDAQKIAKIEPLMVKWRKMTGG